jgi:hypothetical protein
VQAQRRYQRVAFFRELTLTSLAGGQSAPARSFDVSLGGVGVAAAVSPPRGELVRVGFHLKDAAGRPLVENVTGRVAYAQADENGNLLGVEFLEPIRPSTHPELTRELQNI